MSYKFTTDKIEVRTVMEGHTPRYIVKGTGMVSGIPHVYKFNKGKNGEYKTLKSMFTKNCIESIKRQSKNKTLFVDAQHELALNATIKQMVKGKISEAEMKQLEGMLKAKELPFAKLNSIDITDNGLELDTELNPSFRTLDKGHEVYFDSVWNSMQQKFINGISANFANAKIIQDVDGLEVIDDLDVLGFSYTGGPADPDCSINEVAIRAIQEGGNMKPENEVTPTASAGQDVETMKKELEAKNAELEQIKSERAKAEADAKQAEEAAKQKSVEDQLAEQKKITDELQKKIADAEAAKVANPAPPAAPVTDPLNSAKGVVQQIPPPAQPGQLPANDPKVIVENLKKITAAHDENMETIKKGIVPMVDRRMEGMGELVNLQAQINNPTAGMKFDSTADEALARKLMGKGQGDIIVPRRPID